MNFINKLFSESSNISCMRVMSVISLLVGSGIAFYMIYKNCSLDSATPLVSVFVGAAFAGKAGQKYIENKNDTNRQ